MNNFTSNKKSQLILNDKTKIIPLFSSATTSIKQLKLSTSLKIDSNFSKFLTNCPSISTDYRNIKINSRIPVINKKNFCF